jgi:hypothetical protein
LKYRRGMRVLCIVSGENMPPAGAENKVDFAEWVEKARALGLWKRAERRVDSGVHLGSSFGPDGSMEMGSERRRSQSLTAEVGA